MTSPKKRERARRQVERTMQEAYDAAADREFALADKLSRRATDAGFMNPRIWCDRGRIALLCGDPVEADKAFRHAIAIAPGYRDARDELARLLVARGKAEQAARVLEGGLAPDRVVPAPEDGGAADGAGPAAYRPVRTELTDRFDWGAIERGLLGEGVGVLPGFLGTAACSSAALAAAQAVDQEFARDDSGARAVWRFVREPLPPGLAAVRSELFLRLAPIAEIQQARLGRTGRFGADHDAFVTARGGVRRSTVAVIAIECDGHVGPRVCAEVEFPFAFQVALGPDEGFVHVLRELRPGRREHARRTRVGVGDAVLFAQRERCVQIAGIAARQEVAAAIEMSGDRGCAVLEIPFGVGG